MSLHDLIEKPKDKPVIATFLGDAGLGKTSLAATFPKPIFIRAEDGLQAILEKDRPDALPLVSSAQDLWDQLNMLIKEDHDYKTLVIDSVTALERLFIDAVMKSDSKKPKSINQALGGYGAGLSAVGSMHQRVRKAAGMLSAKKGMHIVFVGHADTETIELPDQDAYTRYSLRLGKKSVAPYSDDSDLVGFLKLRTFTSGEDGERKKAISDGSRILVCYATAANISKNRYGIKNDIVFEEGKNPLVGFVPSLNSKKEKQQPKPQPQPEAQESADDLEE